MTAFKTALAATVGLCLLPLGSALAASSPYAGDIGLRTIAHVQWRVRAPHGIRICRDGEVWRDGNRCGAGLQGPHLSADGIDRAFPGGMSPQQYVQSICGRRCLLLDASLRSLMPDGAPALDLVYAIRR